MIKGTGNHASKMLTHKEQKKSTAESGQSVSFTSSILFPTAQTCNYQGHIPFVFAGTDF